MSEDWQSFVDKATGRVYYHNKRTNETSWTIPEGFSQSKSKQSVGSGAKSEARGDATGEGANGATAVKSPGGDAAAKTVDGTTKKKNKKKKKKRHTKTAPVDNGMRESPVKTEPDDDGVEEGDGNAVGTNEVMDRKQKENQMAASPSVIQIQQQQQQQQQQFSPIHERVQSSSSTTSIATVNSETVTRPSSDWTELIDATSGKPYYFNARTKTTTWDVKETMPANRARSSSHLMPRDKSFNRRSVSVDDSALRLAFESRVDSFVRPLTKQNSLQSFTVPQNDASAGERHFVELHGRQESMDSSDSGENEEKADAPAVSTKEVDSMQNSYLGASRSQLLHQKLTERRRTVAYNQSQVQLPAPVASKGHQKSRTNALPAEADGTHTIVLYADKHLQRVKRSGLFKKKRVIPAQKTVSWSAKLSAPLHTIPNPKHQYVALQAFELIVQYMGDRKAKKQKSELAKELLEIALLYVQLRNEICCQLIKQCTKNPKEQNTLRGLQLLYLVVSCFPPTVYDLQESLLYFLQENQKRYPPLSPHFEYSKQTEKTLRRMVSTGPRKTLPKSFDAEIKQQVPIFGVTIDEYMIWQEEIYGNEEMISTTTIPKDSNDESSFMNGGDQGDGDNGGTRIIKPKVLDILVNKLLEMNGLSVEGIFRKPGSTSEVEKLKDRFSNGDLSTSGVQDVHTIASLFKLWLRELVEPIIPDELYNLCIDVARDKEQSLQVVGRLPLYNRSILLYVCQFLHRMTDPEVSKRTKMTIENLAVVFSPNIIRNQSSDPLTVMKHSPLEQQFVKNIILQIK